MGIKILIEYYKYYGDSNFTINDLAKKTFTSYSIAKNTLQHLKKRGIIRVKRVGGSKGRYGKTENIYEITNFGKRWLEYKLGFRDRVSRGRGI
jgi:DNA-binding PadR family transcriptional regulator